MGRGLLFLCKMTSESFIGKLILEMKVGVLPATTEASVSGDLQNGS